jgi:hypothetical protein
MPAMHTADTAANKDLTMIVCLSARLHAGGPRAALRAVRVCVCCERGRGAGHQDMLDLAFGTCERSRLGCQVRLHASMHDKLVVAIPESAHNLMDHIPFPDR